MEGLEPTSAPEESSFLPTWVLDMRKKLAESKKLHAQTELRITSLKEGVQDLTSLISSVTPLNANEKKDSRITKDIEIKFKRHIFHIPPDMLCYIMSYVETQEVLKFEMSSKKTKDCVEGSNFWYISYREQYPQFLQSTAIHFREFVIMQGQSTTLCLRFIQEMKSQRSVPRQRSIEPRRYTRSEKTVSHPMPVFESSNSQLVMSRAESMNSDFRMFSLRCLQAMEALTSYELSPIHQQLADRGVVTVLVSLLSNEAGVLQQFACEILANLLCWEKRIALNYERVASQYGISMSDTSPRAQRASSPISLTDQVSACDGRRQLLSLLSSPSASVNLAQSRQRGLPVSPPTHSSTLTQNNLRVLPRSTSSVQSMTCKGASRALVNLFCNADPVPSLDRDCPQNGPNQSSTKPAISTSLDMWIFGLVRIGALSAFTSTTARQAQRWCFEYYYKSGFLKDQHNLWLAFSPDGSRMRGRGRDQIGVFHVRGQAEMSIEGGVWLIDKCYITLAHHGLVDGDDTSIDAWISGVSVDDWDAQSQFGQDSRPHVGHIGFVSVGVGVAAVSESQYLSHTHRAMERAGLAHLQADHRVRARERPKSVDEMDTFVLFNSNWGGGMWGVWEANSSESSHFDLKKGGVFRARPL